jgi:hypothetical protein
VTEPPRSREQRIADTVRRLEKDVDAWVATAGEGGIPSLAPFSFLWDGAALLFAMPANGPTARNLLASGAVRLGLGHTRDVVLIEGTAQAIPAGEIAAETGDAFAVKTGFEPRELADPYLYFRIEPRRIRAWREVNELAGRDVMRGGMWLDS